LEQGVGVNHFSFVMVLLSIIVGLGVTELLTNIARQIQHRRTTKYYWLHSVIVALVFMALLQQWWESWSLQSKTEWSFTGLLLMLGGPIGIYLISHLLYPAEIEDTDFDVHYYDNARVIAGLGVITVILAALFRPLSFGDPMLVVGNIPTAILLVAFLIATLTNNRKVHQFILPALLVLILFDIIWFSGRI
jgi:hypothetical protein